MGSNTPATKNDIKKLQSELDTIIGKLATFERRLKRIEDSITQSQGIDVEYSFIQSQGIHSGISFTNSS